MNASGAPSPWEDIEALAALGQLAFGGERSVRAYDPQLTRHLAFLPVSALELDLSDPLQREFGDYELLKQLGQGGMGVVYCARQRSLDREVAIKLLSAGPWASQEFIERFRCEAQSAARLQHPNIVAIHEFGSHDELNYFSMDLVRGPNLAQVLAIRGKLPPKEAASLVRRIAEALEYAHRLGVLHLDLKPGNILIDEHGEPQVADFGLARRLDESLGADSDEISGTPNYMAPEQIEPKRHRLGPATDLHGLGAILYELLCGQPPYMANTPQQTLKRVLAGNVCRLRRHDAAIPEDLEAICLKCLALVPGDRYPSARALADDLGRFLESRAVDARPLNAWQRFARGARREPRLAATIGIATVAIVVGLATSLTQWRRAEHNADTARQQTWATRAEAAWRMAREGRTFDAMPLVLDNLREREAQGDSRGTTLERLRLGSLLGSGAQLIDAIAMGAPGSAVALDDSGSRVAVAVGAGQLRMHAVDDGRELWRVDTRTASHFWEPGALARVDFTHDGRHLIVDRGEPDIVAAPAGHDNILVDAGNGRILLPPPERFADFRDATYSADGQYAVLRNFRHEAQFFRVDGWQALSPLRPVDKVNSMWRVGDGGRFIARTDSGLTELLDPRSFTTRHAFEDAPGHTISAWAAQPDGVLLALGRHDGAVRLLDTATLALRALQPAPHESVDWLSFSRDGRWLAAASADRAYVWDVASGSGGVLPAGRAGHGFEIEVDHLGGTAFVISSGEAVLWEIPAAATGTGDLRTRIGQARMLVPQLPLGPAQAPHAAAHAPAAQLAASIDVRGVLRLWRWPGNPLLQNIASRQGAAELHFDGRHVAVADGRDAHVIAVEGGHATSPALRHPQPVSLASLTPDGRTLVTASGRELRVYDWRTATLRFAPITLADTPLRVLISPDSNGLVVTTGGYRGERFVELASRYDLRNGKALATAVALPGPLAGMRFDPGSRHLVHWRYGEASVLDATTLRTIRHFRFGPDMAAARRLIYAGPWTPDAASDEQLQGTPIIDAALSANGDQLAVATAPSDYANSALLQLDVRSGRRLHSRGLGKAVPLRLLPRGHRHELTTWEASGGRWIDSEGGSHALPQTSGMLHITQAVSRDGRWLASTARDGLVLSDRDSRQWASAPLNARLPLGDAISQLAFAPDGSSLLARSQQGRWLWWRLPVESRSQAELQRRLAHLPPFATTDGTDLAPALAAGTRALLRAGDPGAARHPRPLASDASSFSGGPAPAPGYDFVDLRPAINRTVNATDITHSDEVGYYASVPMGTQRYLGIDFQVRGVVTVGMRTRVRAMAAGDIPKRSMSIAVPRQRFDALHLLLGGCCRLQGRSQAPYGFVLIGYADGGTIRVPIVYHRDVWEPWSDPGDALPARIAWVETQSRAQLEQKSRYRLYATRLVNPHPGRKVLTLAFEASDLAWSGPLVFAATLETGAADAPISAAAATP